MDKRFIEAGEIVSTHGIRGEVKILPWADGPEFLLDFDTFYLGGKAYAVTAARIHKTCVLAKLADIDTPEAAMALRGKVICVDRSGVDLPEGTVFIADLLGCRVLDDSGNEIGLIADVLTMPSSDVYVVKGEYEYMIPAVNAFILSTDMERNEMQVKLIEGMRADEN